MNISDAFKDFDILSEDVFDLNASDLEDALDLTNEEEVIDVFDPEEYEDDEDQAYDAEEQIDDIHTDEHKSYIDKLILECDVCHSLMYKDIDDVAFNEELALYNVDEECPYCMSTDGFQLVGKVVPYSEEPEQQDDDVEDDEAEDTQEEIEECADDIVIDPVNLSEAKSTPIMMYKVLSEGKLVGTTFSRDKAMKIVRDLKESYPGKDIKMNRFIRECGDYAIKRAAEQEQLNEADSDVNFDTLEDAIQFLIDDEHEAIDGYEEVKESLEMFDLSDDELEGWNKVIDFIIDEENKHIDMLENAADGNFDIDEVEDDSDDDNEDAAESFDESVEEINIKTEEDTINIQSNDDGGMTVETTSNECEDCETTDKEMIAPITDDEIEEIPEHESDDEEDEVVDEFDEDSFDEVAESYLKKTYSNVDSYITESVHNTDYKLIVEGKINFKSGKSKNTKFVLTFTEDKQGVSVNAINESLAKNYQNLQLKAVVKDNTFIVTDMK